MNVRFVASAAAIAMLAAIVWFIYEPGLSGSFLFDDFVNLPALGDYGPVDNLRTAALYLTSGNADPTGRPVALLSFLIDARNWPSDAEGFKRTNVLLHIVNGLLLCRLLFEVSRAIGYAKTRSIKAALLGAAIWSLHPLWVSTTLYVVQREAMLPATFTLLGLAVYLRQRRKQTSTIWMVMSLAFFTTLAFLSKANGALLPALAFLLERIVRSARDTTLQTKAPISALVFTAGTAVLIALYLAAVGIVDLTRDISAQRPWTEWQRLITEPRVLCDYLGLLLFPHPYSRGLFNDSFVASTSLLHPWTTIPAIAVVAALIALAIAVRRRAPALSLSILFYFSAHAMESTTVPLELYFEHRNYLPAMLLFWPVALWLTSPHAALRAWRPGLAAAVCILLAVETRVAAALWGDPDTQAVVWAAQNPDSPRAQAYAASIERGLGRREQAERRLRLALQARPLEIQLAVNLLGVRCEQGSISDEDFDMAKRALRDGTNVGPLSFDWISNAISLAHDHACEGLTSTRIAELIDAQRLNRRSRDNPRFDQDLLNLEAQLALTSDDPTRAVSKLMQALRLDPRPDVALNQAALLGSRGLPQAGLEELDFFSHVESESKAELVHDMPSLHRWLLKRDGYWTQEMRHLRSVLQDDLVKPAS